MLMTGLGLKVMASFFDQSTLRHDFIGPQLLRPPEPALGHIHLGLGHEIFLDQFIQAQTFNGDQRLTASDAIAQLDMDVLDLSLDPGGNFGDLLQVERDFTGSRYHFWNYMCGGRLGA